MTARFEVIVGRPCDRGVAECEATMRTRLREESRTWVRRETNATQAEADATADRIVADQLPDRKMGVPVVALTADQLRTYFRLTREAT